MQLYCVNRSHAFNGLHTDWHNLRVTFWRLTAYYTAILYTWMQTLDHKLWNITFPMFDLLNYIFECKLWVISCEVLLDVWPTSTLFLNESSWPLVMRYFLIFDLSQPYIRMQTLDHKVLSTSRSWISIYTILKWLHWRKIILCM